MPPADYELLDFGAGRKLERFATVVVDRPSPAAENATPHNRSLWRQAHCRFNRTDGIQGRWEWNSSPLETWLMRCAAPPLALTLRPSQFGHVGVFPEQAENWTWIAAQVGQLRERLGMAPRVLNLFAYTGASTLAAAAAGGEATHVDASKSVVAWARRNATASGLAAAPIRWLCEDAQKYVEREKRRGQSYHGIILDPPSYGHGPSGKAWKLDVHLSDLLATCRDLLSPGGFLLLTCHSPGYDAARLNALLYEFAPGGFSESSALELTDAVGRRLDCGAMARASFP